MNAINWMIRKAETNVMEDGTVEFFFQGTLPYKMVQEIKNTAANRKDFGSEVRYGSSDELTSWSAIFPVSMSKGCSVRFSFHDYTIPAGA